MAEQPLVRGISAELAAARMATVFGGCSHLEAVPVDLLATGERVAWFCPSCDRQLPADYGCRCCPPGNGESRP